MCAPSPYLPTWPNGQCKPTGAGHVRHGRIGDLDRNPDKSTDKQKAPQTSRGLPCVDCERTRT
ncbi:hypothetical protein PT2222_280083 [Paraburkholderia tropica]